MNNIQKKIAWVFGIFILWVIISVFWYVCGIRGFCNKNETTNFQQNNDISENITADDQVDSNIETDIMFHNRENAEEIETEKVLGDVVVVGEGEDVVDGNGNTRTIKCFTYLNSYIKKDSNKNIQSEVLRLEQFFNKFYGKKLIENGDYDYEDSKSVEEFQEKNNLEVDGEVGPKTQMAINAIYCVKTEKK